MNIGPNVITKVLIGERQEAKSERENVTMEAMVGVMCCEDRGKAHKQKKSGGSGTRKGQRNGFSRGSVALPIP